MRPPTFLAALTLLPAAAPASAQVPQYFAEWDAIDYRAKIEALCRTHIDNHLIGATGRTWDHTASEVNEHAYESSRVFGVYGPGRWVEHDVLPPLPGVMAGLIHLGRYRDEVAYATLSRDEARGPDYRLHSSVAAWRKPDAYDGGFGAFLGTKQIYFRRDGEWIASREVCEYEGHTALRLTTYEGATGKTVYLDRGTYQLLHAETDRSPVYGSRGWTFTDDKTITRLTYRDANGKRYPVKYEHYRQASNGGKTPMWEYEFTEYTPYTPTADDLDFERHFGQKPVDHGSRDVAPAAGAQAAKPAGASFSLKFDWWYVACGVLFAMVVGLVVMSRRWGRP